MTEYDNTNRGSIWKNDDKREDKHPDFKGSLNVNGVEFWVSAWKRKEGASPKSPALSFSVKPKEEKPAASGFASGLRKDDMDDAIPFSPEFR
jgi:hypothetical protein